MREGEGGEDGRGRWEVKMIEGEEGKMGEGKGGEDERGSGR